jgi:hypothetical protein
MSGGRGDDFRLDSSGLNYIDRIPEISRWMKAA